MNMDRKVSSPGRLGAVALAASPGIWLAGWAIMRIAGHRGPGLAWTLAHLLWTVAFVLFGVASVALYRMLSTRGAVARTILGVALVGAVALAGQMLIDLGVGFQSADRAAMDANYDRVFEVPGVELAFFVVGPSLLFAGLLALTVYATVRRVTGGATVALVAVSIALMVAGRELDGWLRGLEALGGIGLWLALAPLARARGMGNAAQSARRVPLARETVGSDG